jgi:hypothetical protein
MSPLLAAWAVSLVVALWALPLGFIRMVAYRSGEIDHTSTMRTAAVFALTLGVLGLVGVIVLGILLLL